MNLETIGWNAHWQTAFGVSDHADCIPGRISSEHRGGYEAITANGIVRADLGGRLRFDARSRLDLPAVGDWVALQVTEDARALVHHVLPRTSCFVRRAAGADAEAQTVAANVDTVLIVCGLDRDFNLRRIERYLTLAYESGAIPVVVLNKADLIGDTDHALAQVQEVAGGTAIHFTSVAEDSGIEELRAHVPHGSTAALLGSSGVGKSSLLNALAGWKAMGTAAVRENDSRGRHTTTQRQLFHLPLGGVLIDTPGMREIQLIGSENGLDSSFSDIAERAALCRFRDCSHIGEPGCAVQAAIADCSISLERYESYLQLQRELRHQQAAGDSRSRKQEARRWRSIKKSLRGHHKRRDR